MMLPCVTPNPLEPYACQRDGCHASWYSHSDQGCAFCPCPGYLGATPPTVMAALDWRQVAIRDEIQRHTSTVLRLVAEWEHAHERDRDALEAARAEGERLKEAVAPELVEATEYWRLALLKQEQGYGIVAMYYAAEAELHAGRALAALATTMPAAPPAEQEEP